MTKGRHATIGLGNPSSVRLGNGPLNLPHVFSLTRQMNRLHIARPVQVRGESLSLCSRWGVLTLARMMKPKVIKVLSLADFADGKSTYFLDVRLNNSRANDQS